MAWPCITRACCINRFWSEFDKGDIAVPLVFTKYSDVQQKQPKRAAAAEGRPECQAEAVKAPPVAASDASSSVMRQDFQAWKVRPEPSCKPRNEYQPAAGPFIPETQYQKDYKAWPIPKKHDHPWIPKAGLAPPTGSSSSSSTAVPGKMERVSAEIESGVEKSELEDKVQEKEVKEPAKRDKSADRKADEAPASGKGRAAADALNRHIKQTLTSSNSSYRAEFQAYKDVKPVKPIKAPSHYKPPAENERGLDLETSYSATFRGEQVKAQPADNKLLERRRIRSLYNEPGKEPPKADKPASRVRPKKATTTKTVKKVKEIKEKKLLAASAKKKEEAEAEAGVTKKNKELSNRLAEAKQ